MDQGTLILTDDAGQKYKFVITDAADHDRLAGFFQRETGLALTFAGGEQKETRYRKSQDAARGERNALAGRGEGGIRQVKIWNRVLNVLTGLLCAAAMLTYEVSDGRYPFDSAPVLRVMFAPALVLAVVLMAFYLKNSDVLTMADRKGDHKISFIAPLFSALTLAMASLGFQESGFGPVFWLAVLAVTTGLSAFIIRAGGEYRSRKLIYFMVPFIMLVYNFGIVNFFAWLISGGWQA